MQYVKRSLESILEKAVSQFPATMLTGPRQSGKTTLLRHLFGGSHRYLSLESPDVRLAAASDPRGFLALNPAPAIFDEIQYVPELLFYIKELIDERRQLAGQFILTGSQNLLLQEKVTETLAGRTAVLQLLPLSLDEIQGCPEALFPWERREIACNNPAPLSIRATWELMLRGCYPELIEAPEKDQTLWHSSYIQTYLERDIRNLRQIGDLAQFQQFLRAVAGRSGQLFQPSDLAKDLGISVNTVRSWVGLLEATDQIVLVRPYFANISKRLVKTAKIYFTDVGTLCYLLGIREVEYLANNSMMGGHAFETFVFSQVYKRLLHRGRQPSIYFWRTSAGSEVDLLVEEQGKLWPIEVTSTATPKGSMAKGIAAFQADLGSQVGQGYLVHMGEQLLPAMARVTALPLYLL